MFFAFFTLAFQEFFKRIVWYVLVSFQRIYQKFTVSYRLLFLFGLVHPKFWLAEHAVIIFINNLWTFILAVPIV